jgi:hypothetical protein
MPANKRARFRAFRDRVIYAYLRFPTYPHWRRVIARREYSLTLTFTAAEIDAVRSKPFRLG